MTVPVAAAGDLLELKMAIAEAALIRLGAKVTHAPDDAHARMARPKLLPSPAHLLSPAHVATRTTRSR